MNQAIKRDLTNEESIRDSVNTLKDAVKQRLLENQRELNAKLQTVFNKIKALESQSKGSMSFDNKKSATTPSIYHLSLDASNGKQLYEIYSILNECIEILTARDPIQYVIYYEQDGKLYRHVQGDLSDYVYYSASNKAIRINQGDMIKLMKEEEEYAKLLGQHYIDFSTVIYNCQRTHGVKKTVVNRGHISEAFERHFQDSDSVSLTQKAYNWNHDWKLDEVWRYVSDSVNSVPWYAGGDVGQYQVKNITKGSVRISTLASLQRVYDLLKTTISTTDEQELEVQLYRIIKTLYAKEDLNIEGYTKELNSTINKVLSDLIKNTRLRTT